MTRVLCLSLSLFFIALSLNAQTNECIKHRCLAVVDAGSSGSRLHVYAYDLNERNAAINIKEVWLNKIKPGLSSLSPDQAEVNTYLNTLFKGDPEQFIPVKIYATAGMRMLPQSTQTLIFQKIEHWFSKNRPDQLKDIRTITGREEGVFDWLAVNYYLDPAFPSSATPSVGVMDFGGGSIQIVFPVQNNENYNQADKMDILLNGQRQALYVHSFLGLGQTEVIHQFLDSASCFSNQYLLPDGSPAQGDARRCKKEVTRLINNVHGVNQQVQPVLASNQVAAWYVMGGAVTLAQDTIFGFDEKWFTNQNFLERGDLAICKQNWSLLSEQYPNREYLYTYCLSTAYFYSVMVDGYGLEPEQRINYIRNDELPDWTLGVVLYKKF